MFKDYCTDEVNGVFKVKDVTYKSLLEFVAKIVKFSRDHNDFSLVSADFTSGVGGGVYKARLLGTPKDDVLEPVVSTEFVVKPFVGDIVSEHIICRDLVLKILEDDPYSRDDDMRLLFVVWKAQGINIELDVLSLDTLFSSESVRRSRQKIQNTEGLFPPTTYVVAKRRGLSEDKLRTFYGRGVV